MTLKEQVKALEEKVAWQAEEITNAYEARDAKVKELQGLIEIAMGRKANYNDNFTSATAAEAIATLRGFKRLHEGAVLEVGAERDRLFRLVRSLTGDKTLEKEIEMRNTDIVGNPFHRG